MTRKLMILLLTFVLVFSFSSLIMAQNGNPPVETPEEAAVNDKEVGLNKALDKASPLGEDDNGDVELLKQFDSASPKLG